MLGNGFTWDLKLMQPTSVQDAKLNNIEIKVKSSFVNQNQEL